MDNTNKYPTAPGLYMISGIGNTSSVTGNFLKDLWANNKPLILTGAALVAIALLSGKKKRKKAK